MDMWPWWRNSFEPDEGVYRLICFAGADLSGGCSESVPIAVLESLTGGLNIAVPITQLGGSGQMQWVSPQDAKKDFDRSENHRPWPGSVRELARKLWSVHPREVTAAGMTRPEWYEREINSFIGRSKLFDDEEDV